MLTFDEAFDEMPLIGILRGVRPAEVVEIASALDDAGIRIVEVPLNSPDPLDSIARLAAMKGRMVWGAGTVLSPDRVDDVVAAGGSIIVSPNVDQAVIHQAVKHGAEPLPGFATATEAFAALAAGARIIKLFPAATYGAGHVKALSAVLPSEALIVPVGGVGPDQMAEWWAAGARGFGLGSDLYRPGMTAADVHIRARAAVDAIGVIRR
jgi:2-dehydro-3-deoxyphosphogalactonate aldolase